jgi:hypothetical protein
MNTGFPQGFLDLLNSVDAKRLRTVIQHILEHGLITSQDLKDTYGYNHPPRTVRDVREYSIPLIKICTLSLVCKHILILSTSRQPIFIDIDKENGTIST